MSIIYGAQQNIEYTKKWNTRRKGNVGLDRSNIASDNDREFFKVDEIHQPKIQEYLISQVE